MFSVIAVSETRTPDSVKVNETFPEFIFCETCYLLRMMYYSVSDTAGKRKSEHSYQELNLRPPDY